ncbi:hypothetical protein N0V82_002405 [Gnomoniopsis sp. IMI 355080]|nr:hypothetical protein N0V82_002405 [Gnomoniopsis sp. IMI 355080]
MDLIDFDSDAGFFQAAGKRKKKQTTTFNWLDDEGDKKDGDGAEEGGDGNKDQNDGAGGGSGSTGGDGGDGEDKKDDDKKDEMDNNDDIWDFAPAGNKKKNKKKSPDGTDSFGLPDIPSTDFHEIKLDDGGGGQPDDLDLGLIPKAEKITAGLTAWTSSWTTGSWGWGGLKSPGGSDLPKPVDEDKPKSLETVEDNPWGINRGKPKKQTTTFNFGSFDEGESKKEDSFDFLGTSEPKEKKDVGAFTWGLPAAKTADDDFWGKIGDKKSTDDKPKEEEKAADAEASDDIWGFSSSKKDKKKKNKIAVVEESAISEEPPPEAPEPPQATIPADNAISEAEAALIAEEEAELRKLQTKKDIGTKLTKKQQDRLKILTENAKAREEAAATGAAESKVEDPPPTIGDNSIEKPASDIPTPQECEDTAQIEADENALIIQEEEDEMYILRSKKKLKKSEKDRLRILEERADDRAREAEEAAAAKEQQEAVPEVIDAAEAPAEDPPVDTLDSAQAEADENARVIQEEEDELAELRSKKKLKKADKERLRVLEERADDRAREAENAAATAAADQSVPESSGDTTEAKTEETVPTSVDDALGDDSTAQAEKDEAARLIEEEEFEMELLLSKSKLKKADKARLKELQDNKERREQEAADEAVAGGATKAADAVESSPADDAPAGGDSADVEHLPTNEEDDLAAKIIEEEEMELEILLSKSKLKKADKARLKVLQDNKEQREWEAAQKAETSAEAPPAEDQPIVEEPAPEESPVDEAALSKQKEAAQVAAEEDELSDLLAKGKLKKGDKARLKELQDRKDQREWEAAQMAETVAEDPPTEDPPAVDKTPPAPENPVDEAALQKEKEDAEIAAEEQELSDLLSKVKLKKAEKARLKELQDRKDKRDEDIRLAAEQAEQQARELEEQKKRDEEEKAAAELAAEIAAEEAEISSLESKKKLKRSEKERLADLKFRRDERASAEAAKLADDLMKEDAENDTVTKDEAQPLSWADDDPAKDNGGGDDWMNWGGLTSSSKSKKSKEESVPVPPAAAPEPEKVEEEDTWGAWGTGKKDKKKKSKGTNLIEFGGNDDTPAVPDPPTVPETGFDFGWGKPTPKDEPVDDIWSFGSSSKKKKSKNAGAEVVDDTNLASTVVPDPMSATKDKGEDDFWATFGSKKSKDKKSGSSSKEDLVAEPPLPSPSPVGIDLTATEEGDVDGNALGDLSGSIELSKSKFSEKESKKSSSSSKDPKLSKKELEKIEKEKKKAEKEQKAREEQEAKDAAELARLEEEERLEAEAKAEAERLAQEEADRILKEEEEKQAALDAIAKEEADLAVLQAKKDSGKKLLKKEKEKYDKLSASCQARADEKAAQEAAEQAARDEAERLQREAEEQARQEAIEKEESELKDLQKKKDSGRKLLKKDKDRYEELYANKKARRQAEKDAEAAKNAEIAKDEPAAADEANLVDPLEKDLAKLDANELDELDAFLSAPPKAAPTPKAAEVDPFSFWGASKKPTSSSKKGKSSATETVSPCNPREPQHVSFPQHQFSATALALAFTSSQSAAAEIAHAESSSSCKLLEAATPVIRGGTNDKAKDVLITGGWFSTQNDAVLSPSQPLVVEQANGGTQYDEPTPPVEPMKRTSGVSKSKIADRLKAFEAVPPPPPPAPADLIPPPPPPPAAPVEESKSKRKSKKVDIPGSFPDEYEEGHPDDIIEVIEMPVRTKKSSSKKSSKAKSDAVPIPIPPPPPAVPDAPILPPLEAKKETKKERPKINRDGGSSWGTWTATTPQKDKKASSKSKSADEPKKARKERSPEKEDKLSSKGSSSDKAERSAKKEKDMETSRPKLKSVFASTPPISRSTSTREKRHKEGRSSRRPSIDVASGQVSPPPEEMPEVGSKAAKILGIGLGRSASKRKNSLRPAEDEDIVMVGATDAESPEKSSRRRTSKVRFSHTLDSTPKRYADDATVQSYHHDDDIVMVDVADASPAPGLKRSNTTGSTRKGFGGLFGGILSKPPAELKRRNTSHTDGEDAGAATDADAEARKAARRARRVEKEVAEKSKDEIRREKRRKQEEEAEAQRQADREARRAERRAAREREADRRKVDEDKDERRRRKRAERDKEREGLETGAEDAEAEARRVRRERRKVRAGESDRETDADRRRRRTEKRGAREAEGRIPTRRRTEPVEDDFVYPRPTKISRRHTDGLAKAAEPPAWPHSGTSSWVKDHSDAGPPPDDGGMTTEVPEDGEGDEDAARRERRRRRRYGDVEVGGDDERRRKRHEDRSEGSDERRRERKGSMFADGVGAGRTSSGGFGGLWKKLTRN